MLRIEDCETRDRVAFELLRDGSPCTVVHSGTIAAIDDEWITLKFLRVYGRSEMLADGKSLRLPLSAVRLRHHVEPW